MLGSFIRVAGPIGARKVMKGKSMKEGDKAWKRSK